MNKIITMDDLIDYLKIPDFTQKVDQEIITIKITQEQDFQEETMLLKDFPRENKEVSISQRFFMDANNIGYYKQVLLGDVYYKNISYDTDERVFTDADFQEPLVEVTIPEKIYNGGFQFFINPNNQLVGLVEIVHAYNSKDYISFNPGDFSLFNENTYHYTNVYGVKVNENLGISVASLSASVHRFPILSKLLGDSNPYQLSYYYKKDANKMLPSFLLDEDEIPMIALRISFKTLSGVLSFLKETIFNYYNEVNDFRSKWRHRFLERLGYHITPVANKSSLNDKKALIYQIPEALYHVFYNNSSLWAVVQTLASGNITNVLGTNEEDLLLKLLKILYHRYTHKYNNKQDVGRKVVEEKELVYVREQNDTYLKKLLTIKTDNNTLLQKLVNGLDGEQFQTYIYFIWSIWKNSSYANINPETNKLIEITDESPVILAYKSNKVLGFHSDNATINWETEKAKIEFKVRVKVGTKEEPEIINVGYGEEKSRLIEASRDIYETFTYNYHPFSPIVVLNSETPSFILKEQGQEEGSLYTKLPAFLLYANGQTAFWKNVFTGVEYALDILSTVSGVGNLLKVGRLVRILNRSKTLLGKTKHLTLAITAVKAVTGVVEVSTGTVNTLLKLTNVNDTELGKNISKYLFYLEMACLAGEVSVFLKGKLSKTAKEIIENPKFTKSLDDLVKKGELDELGKKDIFNEIEEASLMARPREIGKLGGKVLRASQIRKLRGDLRKKGVLLILEEDLKIKKITNQFKPILLNGVKFEKAQDLFYFMKVKGFAGAFDARTKQMVLGEKSTELVAFHEKAHLKHFEELGEAYHPLKTWEKETYVWEQIWSRRRDWTKEELELSLNYANRERKKAGIDLIKIKL
ncbi:zincin-like metallopeptidase toxin domain-containing protein [Tenacibaculum sp. TC6]|uniref:zincin-like metallopeptidase toxin domain-containing protein n=1 Tax=Tenacibaculum sp. TC6 TaxID=3423223 RepID=UPI003D36ECE1